jgi:transcriptional regulator with XRE-family HTH domain
MTFLFAMTPLEFRAIRKRLGLTQVQLAEILGYQGALAISSLERKSNPRPVPRLLMIVMRAFEAGYRPSNWPKEPRPQR